MGPFFNNGTCSQVAGHSSASALVPVALAQRSDVRTCSWCSEWYFQIRRREQTKQPVRLVERYVSVPMTLQAELKGPPV